MSLARVSVLMLNFVCLKPHAVRSAPALVAFFDNVKDRLGLAIPVGSHEHLDTRLVFHVFELGNFLARLVGAPVELVLGCWWWE